MAEMCPTCHRAVRARRTAIAPAVRALAPAEGAPAKQSTAELFKAFKQSAPWEDFKFFMARTTAYPSIQDAALRLYGDGFTMAGQLTISRSEFYRRFVNIQADWRRQSNARERVERLRDMAERAASELAALQEGAA